MMNAMDERTRKDLLGNKEIYERAIAHPDWASPKTTPKLAAVYQERLHIIEKLLTGQIDSEHEYQTLDRINYYEEPSFFSANGQYDGHEDKIGLPWVGNGKPAAADPWSELCNPETTSDETFEKTIKNYEPMTRDYLRTEREDRKYALANPPTEADKAYGAWCDSLTEKERKRLPWYDQLEWIALQIKRKRFKTLKQLAKAHDQPLWWAK